MPQKFVLDVKAYTVGFEAPNFRGEVQDARRFADFLKIELIEKTYTFNDFTDAFYPTIKALSTPLADPCAVAVFLLAKMASKQTNTILSGEGADELFCGYKPYSTTVWSRRFGNTHNFANNLLYPLSKLFPKDSQFRNLVRNQFFPLYGHYFGPTSLMTDYEHRQYLSTFCEKGFVKAQMGKYLISKYSHSRLQQMQMFDFKTWLVSDILCVANRLNRVHGICLHLPYLSDSVFNIAKNCRDEEKISECQNKIILRKTFSDLLPDSLVNKPKAGFPVPVSIWIKNELYSWAFEILSSDEAKVVLHSQNAIELLKNYSQGNAPQHYFRYLWLMICLVGWFKANDNTSHKA